MAAADWEIPQDRALSQTERDYVHANKTAPWNWRIWLGHYERKNWPGYWVRHPMQIAQGLLEEPHLPTTEFNSQSVSYVVGKVYVQAICSAVPTVAPNWRFPDRLDAKLRQIWPRTFIDAIEWPPPTLNDTDADDIARAFFDVGAAAARRYRAENPPQGS